ncbi:MAG: DUF2807 domain-containing protein [Muribaculaceae bacterium]|nr:DUF2807 domain-containing protein [Muribaculaceae bacterium]
MKNFKIYTLLATLLLMGGWKTQAQNYKVDGNGVIVTRDFNVTGFDEINTILPADINYTVSDNYSCRVTLDENLFEYLDILTKGDDLVLRYNSEKGQAIQFKPTEFRIELSAPTIEEISMLGSGEFCFITPFETQQLEISIAGSSGVTFAKTATIPVLKTSIAGSGKLMCKELIADHADLSIAGSGDVYIESGKVTSADVSVAGSGTIETRCQLESMDYSITGSGVIRYLGRVKVKGQRMGGKLIRIDSENEDCKSKK